ncbi:MarR family transcriptional regulator [Planosporangium thailandense]|uniref:MarR family transcriptional regulator n=1 Tax=Planosporangium thailandense TaxID=765197 RepID=A0ABX0Y7X8_9ACTN|nr:MarR family transcriptional regulator [Planosporangium thailandense]NJC73384.1 MarR family transcriptional regulator [Planosporangium thailandense]
MAEPRWLDETERRAWLSLMTLVIVGLPEIERTFRAHGLVHVEYGLLAALSEQPDGLRLCDLAQSMNVSPSRLSHRMRKLIERGYVQVRGSDDDGRVSIAVITEAGRRLIEEVAPQHAADVRRLLFDRLSREQTAALADALASVAGQLAPCPGAEVETAP